MRVAWTPARLDGEEWDPVLVHSAIRTTRCGRCKEGRHDLCLGQVEKAKGWGVRCTCDHGGAAGVPVRGP